MSTSIDTDELTEAVGAYNEQRRTVDRLRTALSCAAQARDDADAEYREACEDLKNMAAEVVDHCRGAVEVWERSAP